MLRDKTLSELELETNARWTQVREQRDRMIADVSWRYERHGRHARLGLPQVDDLTALDAYVQELADLPQTQTDPFNMVWPTYQTALDHTHDLGSEHVSQLPQAPITPGNESI